MSTTRGSEMAGPTGRRHTVSRVLAAWIGALALALTGMSVAQAQAAPASNQLKDIQVQPLPGNQLELRLLTTGPASEPLAFTIDNPARISLDLQGTTLALDKRRKDVNIGPLVTILAAEAGGKTRIVLNLDTMVPYQTRVDGNAVVVTLGAPQAAAAAVTSFPAPNATAATAGGGAASSGRSVSGVDFRRGENGAGRVVITLSDPATPVDVRKEGDRVVLSFNGATLPASLQKRLDVTDFATPVNSIESASTPSGTRVSIAAKLPFQELAYQSDSVFTVEIAPVVVTEKDLKPTLFSPDRDYSGERLTLSFQDIETRAVLQLLADVSGRNIIVSDSVAGNVTLRLQNVPWDQALDIVLATKGLDMRENGGVIIVAPADEIAAREKADLEARKDILELEPLFSEYLQVNYAKAADLAELMKGGKGNSLLSERGTVAIDERTNTLLVKDVSDHIAQIRRLVSTLDIPVRQVLIEARIVIVNDDFSRDLGVRWGVTAINDTSDGLVAVTGSSTGTNTIVNSALSNQQSTGSMYPVQLPALNDRYNVNLPLVNPAGRIGLALLGEDYLVDLELSALQAEGRGEVISSPRVITANQKEASIRQGVEIAYQEAASSGATTTQFKDAVLSLTVTPQITPDDRIILDLKVTKDSVGATYSNERGGSVPSIDTREVDTQVLVNNGQTVVLGGVYETEEGETVSKVPFLGDLPGVGVLFRSTRKVSNKSELLIFVTPKILKEGSNIY